MKQTNVERNKGVLNRYAISIHRYGSKFSTILSHNKGGLIWDNDILILQNDEENVINQ